MRVWDIARLLITDCASPEEVEQVLKILSDKSEMDELREMLSHFSLTGTTELNRNDARNSVKDEDGFEMEISQLVKLFRNQRMYPWRSASLVFWKSLPLVFP